MRLFLTLIIALSSLFVCGQSQIDFRGILAINVEKKISKSFSATFLNQEIFTYDFHELGFSFVDVGIKYKLNRNIGFNGNYRYIFRRNLDNFYNTRQMIYGDIDLNKRLGKWSVGGTVRVQAQFYTHIVEGYKTPLVYNRDRINLKYRVNYFIQPFIEFEMFYPINHPTRKNIDQIRGVAGVTFTINDFVKVEIYERVQKYVNRFPQDLYFVTAVGWYFRF